MASTSSSSPRDSRLDLDCSGVTLRGLVRDLERDLESYGEGDRVAAADCVLERCRRLVADLDRTLDRLRSRLAKASLDLRSLRGRLESRLSRVRSSGLSSPSLSRTTPFDAPPLSGEPLSVLRRFSGGVSSRTSSCGAIMLDNG